MEKIEFKIRTLTPLWSGDIFGKSEKLRQTAILGSLRYIGEALLRSFGLFVCPTIGENKSNIKNCIYKGKESELCAGCYVWGATGWQRQFRFYFDGKYSLKTYKLTDFWLKEILGKKSETVKMVDIQDTATIQFHSLNTFNALEDTLGVSTEDYLHLLIYTASEFGTIGSKARTGFGFFEVVDGIDKNRVINGIKSLKQNREKIKTVLRNEKTDPDLPDIGKFVRYDFEIHSTDKFLSRLKNTLNNTGRGYTNILDKNASFKQFFENMVNGWYIKYYIRKKIKDEGKQYRRILGSKEQGSLFYVSCIYTDKGKPVFRVIVEDITKAEGFDNFIEKIFKPDATLVKKKVF